MRERIERTQPLLQKPLELDAVNKIEIAEIAVEDITESATDAADTEEEIL